ncbi:MAG: helix-turn-helix domain-containing protein [Brevundimonas sp.]|uniref:helix-turn-helix domain-containing protein n=1 Tax=Brevundimonas sp. TaxID=1871086 RepID=UPI00391D2640
MSQTEYEKRIDARIGQGVRVRREALGLSQKALGSAIGVTFQQLQKYEQGTNRIASSKLVRIADALECEASELLDEEVGAQPGAGRMIRAWSRLDAKQREAVTRMMETFVR